MSDLFIGLGLMAVSPIAGIVAGCIVGAAVAYIGTTICVRKKSITPETKSLVMRCACLSYWCGTLAVGAAVLIAGIMTSLDACGGPR